MDSVVQMTGCVHGISAAKYQGQTALICWSVSCNGLSYVCLDSWNIHPTNQLNRCLEGFFMKWIKPSSTPLCKGDGTSILWREPLILDLVLGRRFLGSRSRGFAVKIFFFIFFFDDFQWISWSSFPISYWIFSYIFCKSLILLNFFLHFL